MPRCALQLISITTLSCALLLLCGCEIRIDVHLRADGTGTANVTCYLSPSDQAMGATAADIKQVLAEQFRKQPDVKITQGSSSGGTQYVKATVPFAEGSGNRLDNSLTGRSVVPVQFELEMPGKILATNADSVHGNVAHWSDAALKRIRTSGVSPEGLYAESETTGMFPYRLVLPILASIVAVGILLYLLRSRKLKSPQAIAGAVTPVKPCPSCGAQNRPEAVFCLKCGTHLPEAQSTPTVGAGGATKLCPDCGAQNRFEVNFCTKCGIRFREVQRTTL